MEKTNNYILKGQQNLEELTQQNQQKDEQSREPKKRAWGDILNQIHYSAGPGDNVYCYG